MKESSGWHRSRRVPAFAWATRSRSPSTWSVLISSTRKPRRPSTHELTRAVESERYDARMNLMTGGGDLSNFVPVADPGAHHDGSELYVPAQTPQLGDVVPVRVRVPSGTGVDSVFVRVVRDAEPMFIAAAPD